MGFMIDAHADMSSEELEDRYRRYNEYLQSIKDRLPPATFEFASAPWHYDASDHRCPHDAWVEEISIRELAPEDNPHDRRIDIYVRLLGAYHDGHIELLYRQVRTYSIGKSFPVGVMAINSAGGHTSMDSFFQDLVNQGHNDWLVDEIRLSEQGLVLHEIKFLLGHWIIECNELTYEWKPFVLRSQRDAIH